MFAILAVALSQTVTLNSTTGNSTADLEVFAVFEPSGEDVSRNLTNVMNEETGALEEDEVAITSTKGHGSFYDEVVCNGKRDSADGYFRRFNFFSDVAGVFQTIIRPALAAGNKPHSPAERTIPEGSENILRMIVNQLNSLAKCPSGEVCTGESTKVISVAGIVLLIGWLME